MIKFFKIPHQHAENSPSYLYSWSSICTSPIATGTVPHYRPTTTVFYLVWLFVSNILIIDRDDHKQGVGSSCNLGQHDLNVENPHASTTCISGLSSSPIVYIKYSTDDG